LTATVVSTAAGAEAHHSFMRHARPPPCTCHVCRKKKVKGADGITRELNSVTSMSLSASEMAFSDEDEGGLGRDDSQALGTHLDDFEEMEGLQAAAQESVAYLGPIAEEEQSPSSA
jgi:hypothetical protein